MKHQRINHKENRRLTFYSIRKISGFGAASIAVSALLFLACNNVEAYAAENESKLNHKVENFNQTQTNYSPNQIVNEQEHPIETDKLRSLINQYKQIDLSNKTENSIERFRNEIVQAESILNTAKSQEEVNQFYRRFLNAPGNLQSKTINLNQEADLNPTDTVHHQGISANNTEPSSDNHHSTIEHIEKGVSF